MKLTKYTHACVRLEDGDAVLVIDPGVFSETGTALAGAAAVLITHEHADHLDEPALHRAVAAEPDLQIYAPDAVATVLEDLGDRVHAVQPQQTYQIAGFEVATFGGQHALVHPSVPVVANVAYLVNDAVLHPGDSFTVPPVPVDTLLLPLHAPWSKSGEVVDYTVSVRAPHVHQIHDALLTETGRTFVENHVRTIAGRYGCEYRYLAPDESVDIR
jgi:L-ascorbate metabolism protein UlaG (beta-lactamase superfamily)